LKLERVFAKNPILELVNDEVEVGCTERSGCK